MVGGREANGGGEEDEAKQKEKKGEAYWRERRRRWSPAGGGATAARRGGTGKGCEKERKKGESEGQKNWGTAVCWETKTRRADGRAMMHGRLCAFRCVRLVRTVGRTGVRQTVRPYCLRRTAVRPCATAVRHAGLPK